MTSQDPKIMIGVDVDTNNVCLMLSGDEMVRIAGKYLAEYCRYTGVTTIEGRIGVRTFTLTYKEAEE